MVSVLVVASACGKKGPPLPPLVKVPAPPADVTAVRRGSDVILQFTIPNTNTDGTRPANVERVDVYAFTGPDIAPDDRVLKLATKIGSVPVKAPRDPDLTVDAEESGDEIEPPEGEGLDQGATAHVDEPLTPASLVPIDSSASKARPTATDDRPRPLLGPPPMPPIRTYVAIGIAKRGRKGPLSKRVGVPLVTPPPPPSAAKIEYNENEITVTWTPPANAAPAEPSESRDVALLPSRSIGSSLPEIAYNVYQIASGGEVRLTKSPIVESKYTDQQIAWGTERCYFVRTVEILGGLSIESDAPPPACTKLVDSFAPTAPKELHTVAGEGSINLIWEPNNEKDLAGYLVLRGPAPGDTLDALTPKPVPDARYVDDVKPGVRYVYAVQAVDKAGNISPMSNRVEETAR